MDVTIDEITDLIQRDFDISRQETMLDEENLLLHLSDEVALMIETRLDYLLGLMYRLDIDEHKISSALAFGNEDPANIALAKLILERQKQRLWSKKTFISPVIEDWEDFN